MDKLFPLMNESLEESQQTPRKSMFKKPSRLSLPAQRRTPKPKELKEDTVTVKPAWDDSVAPTVETTRTKLKPANLTPFKVSGPVNPLRGPNKDVAPAAGIDR
jgi:hypothetical protein